MKTTRLMMVIVLTICAKGVVWASSPVKMSVVKSTIRDPFRVYSVSTEFYPGYLPTSCASDPTEWELQDESDDIYIYERWIPTGDGRRTMERKGNLLAACSINEAVKLITSHERMKSWMKDIEESSLIKKISDCCWITYTLFDLPWPFENRDMVSEYSIKEVKPGQQVEVSIRSIDNLVKTKNGTTRITKYKASWIIKKVNEHKVWISFVASCDNPPAAPHWIQDPVMRKTFHKNLLNLRSNLE